LDVLIESYVAADERDLKLRLGHQLRFVPGLGKTEHDAAGNGETSGRCRVEGFTIEAQIRTRSKSWAIYLVKATEFM